MSTRGKETVDNNKKVEKRLEWNGRRERGRINDRFGSLLLAYTISIVASNIPKYIGRCSHVRIERHSLVVSNFKFLFPFILPTKRFTWFVPFILLLGLPNFINYQVSIITPVCIDSFISTSRWKFEAASGPLTRISQNESVSAATFSI